MVGPHSFAHWLGPRVRHLRTRTENKGARSDHRSSGVSATVRREFKDACVPMITRPQREHDRDLAPCRVAKKNCGLLMTLVSQEEGRGSGSLAVSTVDAFLRCFSGDHPLK